ncbi:hypothetical protein EZS27_014457 [termite gut metagenome]|uniref:Uncharacterized protein n=1 Tax=termite gut metagenome TaxID=433724 RepID=A0A5J4RUT7_9ZZZZ
MTTKVPYKHTKLIAVLYNHFGGNMNLVRLFGIDTIDCLPADREFIGE